MNTPVRNQFDDRISDEVEFAKLCQLAQQMVIRDMASDGRIIGLKLDNTEHNAAFAKRFESQEFKRPRSWRELLAHKPRIRFKLVWNPEDGRFRFCKL